MTNMRRAMLSVAESRVSFRYTVHSALASGDRHQGKIGDLHVVLLGVVLTM